MVNLYNNNVSLDNNQSIYDAFNNFIISHDRDIFNKLVSRLLFYEMTKNLLGDIVECGVFKGSGLATWLKILDLNEPHSIKKVIGFDFFDKSFVENIEDDVDKKAMEQVFERCKDLDIDDISVQGLTNKFIECGFKTQKFQLVKGNISETSKTFLVDKPGFRISVLYLDLDLDIPTYDALTNMWDRVVDGGVVVFDEYAYHNWSEANAVDRFVKENGLTVHSTNMKTPTAYVMK